MSATKDTVRLVGEPIAVNNNFDMLRFGFAAMVFFVHSYALSGNVHLAWIPQVVSSEMAVHALRSVHITNRIHIVRDGAAALDFLFASGEYAHRRHIDLPQVILLDLSLPKIDGLEVLRRIKADPRTRKIPVIVLTSSSSSRDIAASTQLGAEAYIIKPVDPHNLIAVTPQLGLQWALLKSMPIQRA